MKKLRNIRNNIKEFLCYLFDSAYFLSFIFFFMLIVMSGIADFHRYQVKKLQDQLTIQQSHTNWRKMEAERNGIALQECAIDNKNNKAKLEEIKSILGFND